MKASDKLIKLFTKDENTLSTNYVTLWKDSRGYGSWHTTDFEVASFKQLIDCMAPYVEEFSGVFWLHTARSIIYRIPNDMDAKFFYGELGRIYLFGQQATPILTKEDKQGRALFFDILYNTNNFRLAIEKAKKFHKIK
jgi:hypothetical protein